MTTASSCCGWWPRTPTTWSSPTLCCSCGASTRPSRWCATGLKRSWCDVGGSGGSAQAALGGVLRPYEGSGAGDSAAELPISDVIEQHALCSQFPSQGMRFLLEVSFLVVCARLLPGNVYCGGDDGATLTCVLWACGQVIRRTHEHTDTNIHRHRHKHTHTHTHINTHARACAHTRALIHTYTRARAHTGTHARTHARTHTHTHTHTHARTNARARTHTQTHAHTCARARARAHLYPCPVEFRATSPMQFGIDHSLVNPEKEDLCVLPEAFFPYISVVFATVSKDPRYLCSIVHGRHIKLDR